MAIHGRIVAMDSWIATTLKTVPDPTNSNTYSTKEYQSQDSSHLTISTVGMNPMADAAMVRGRTNNVSV